MTSSIVVVDDTADSLRLLKDILEFAGYAVRAFNSGELALRSVLVEAPELILLDIRMPFIDGFEVCRRIKGDVRLQAIPIIFISAATDTEDIVKAFQAGGIDYVSKPYRKEEVIARVQTHVALFRSTQQLIRTEKALRKSEQSLKIAQAVAHLGHWEMDTRTGQVTWSDEIYRIFGYEPNGIAASYEAFLNVIHPDDRERVAGQIDCTQRGGDFDIEYRIVLPDGRVRVVHGRGVLVSAVDGEQPSGIIGTVQSLDEVVGVVQDITLRKEMEWRLEHEARTDFLTGCATRRYFLELANLEFMRIRRYGGDLSVLMVDIDHFKKVNDQYGHQAGDLVLQKLVQVCRRILRQEDFLGRLGGEEFAIVLVETGRERACHVAERLREAVAVEDNGLDGQTTLRVTASIGIATMEAADAEFAAVLARSDQALYAAKKAGRNCVV